MVDAIPKGIYKLFCLQYEGVGALIGPSIRIELANDTPIFCYPYRCSDMEKDLIRSRMLDLLEAGLWSYRMVNMH
jgi:hypothetical protein